MRRARGERGAGEHRRRLPRGLFEAPACAQRSRVRSSRTRASRRRATGCWRRRRGGGRAAARAPRWAATTRRSPRTHERTALAPGSQLSSPLRAPPCTGLPHRRRHVPAEVPRALGRDRLPGAGPRATDARGAGVLSLLQALHFAGKRPELMRAIFKLASDKSDGRDFPFMTVSINMTHVTIQAARSGWLHGRIAKSRAAYDVVHSSTRRASSTSTARGGGTATRSATSTPRRRRCRRRRARSRAGCWISSMAGRAPPRPTASSSSRECAAKFTVNTHSGSETERPPIAHSVCACPSRKTPAPRAPPSAA